MALQKRWDLVKHIEKLIPIWSMLEDKDKQNCKLLIDSKIHALPDAQPYVDDRSGVRFMEDILGLQAKLAAAKFDLGSIKKVISMVMGDLMKKDGLEYTGVRVMIVLLVAYIFAELS